MANTTISPNMNLPVPVPGTDPGPDWANNLVADMYAIDSHNHSSGQGVQITPDGININADLPLNSNDLTTARSVSFTAQAAPLSAPADLGCLYVSGSDLYYNDEAGNQVRITQSGSVTGSTGTITGLPSGTASASYSVGTFTFQGATNTPATMSLGPVKIGSVSVSPKFTTLASSASQAADISLVLPLSAPSANTFLGSDGSGNMSWAASTGSGSVVLATSPTFAGSPAGTILGAAFTPTIAWVYSSGGTATFTITTTYFYYHRIGNIVTVHGYIDFAVSAYSGSAASYTTTSTIPIATSSLLPAGVATSSSQGATFSVIGASSSLVTQSRATQYFANAASDLLSFCYTYIIN